jgi:serine/threonine-protein kinase
VILGTQAKGFQDDAYALCPSASSPCANADAANDLMEKGRSRALGANIAYGVGAAAVVGGAVLWFVGAPRATESRVAVTATGRSLGLAVRF